MTKLTKSQARILDALRNGARIQRTGYGVETKMTLMIPRTDGVADVTWETVRDATMLALINAKAVKRIGDAYSRDAYWVAA